MNARNRAGATVEPDQDVEAPTNGNGSASNGHGSNGNGAHGNGNGNGDAARTKKRRSTTATGVPKPERGSASQRGTSSSSVARKPSAETDTPTGGEGMIIAAAVTAAAASNGSAPEAPPAAATSVFEPPPAEAAEAGVAEDTTTNLLEPPAPIALPAAPADLPSPTADAVVFDDAAMSEPFGIPMVETPEEQEEDVQPLPIPVITTPPAARGSQTQVFPDPTWAPAAHPDVPFEPPYVTSTTMTSHQVAPVPRVVGRRPRVRKVTRVLRHVDPWSVFKVALVFNIVIYGVLLTAGVLLWNVAYATGTIDNLERFFESFGWSEFEFNGGAIYHSAWIAGLFGVIGLTGAAVLAATLFNLITDLVGGVRMTVLEEEVVEKTTAPMRRFTVRRTGAANPDAEPMPGSEPEVHPATVPLREQFPAEPAEAADPTLR